MSEQDLLAISTLNKEQKHAYDTILEKVLYGEDGAYFINGSGGTGKTYLYQALLSTVRSKGLVALATATSRIAISIQPGRTAHSQFKIPINMEDNVALM